MVGGKQFKTPPLVRGASQQSVGRKVSPGIAQHPVRISAPGEMDGELLCTHGSPWAESDAVGEEEEEEEYVAEVDVAEAAVRSGGGEGAVRPP